MSETISTKEAAEILGLTRQRVVQLINAGHLIAKQGRYGAYSIDCDELERFQSLERGPGISVVHDVEVIGLTIQVRNYRDAQKVVELLAPLEATDRDTR